MRSKILNPEWFYDLLLNRIQENVIKGNEKLEELRKIGASAKTALGLSHADVERIKAYNYQDIGENSQFIRGIEAEYVCSKKTVENKQEELEKCRKAHPFFLGGATLESLLNDTPTTYEYITQTRVPFDNIFFEFAEPVQTGFPFREATADIQALWLTPFESKQADGHPRRKMYTAKAYLMKGDTKEQYCLSLFFGADLQGEFQGFLGLLAEETMEDRVIFSIDTNERKVKYTLGEKAREIARQRLWATVRKVRGDKDIPRVEYEREERISEVKNNLFLQQIPNLCTNIINYINAHNVTIVTKEREVIELERDERNKKKKKVHQRPFHLIVVKDKVIEEPESPKETGQWTLQERLYVRGHDRRYRDDTGNIRMTLWISPYVKGPPNAPWREQRYAVLADKLMREKEMMKKYGI